MLMSLLWVEGRNSRMKWWLTGMALGMSFYILMAWYLVSTGIVQHIKDNDTAALAVDGLGLVCLLGFMTIATTWISIINDIRRLHDLNKSGWWMLVYYLPTVLAMAMYLTSGNNAWTIYSYFLPFLAGSWRLIELGFMPGDPGANDFGDPYGGSYGRMNVDDEIRALEAAAGVSREAPAPQPQVWQPAPAPAAIVPARASFGMGSAGSSFGKRR